MHMVPFLMDFLELLVLFRALSHEEKNKLLRLMRQFNHPSSDKASPVPESDFLLSQEDVDNYDKIPRPRK